MKFTLGWLREHLETEAGLDEIAERLTMIGLEVEEVSDPAARYAAFTVAHVVAAEPHPDADRLRVCTVDTGGEQVQVVCGAPNARAGMKGVFAPVGSHIPGSGLELKKGRIRGVESNGMLVSEREMGLSDEHEGIIELPADAEVGRPFASVMGLDDPVVEIAITPNRQDCLGVHGIARDLAAAGIGTLKPLAAAPVAGKFKSPVAWHIDLPAEATDACPMVVGRYFRGVTNGPSPRWMQDRLRSIGLRPISALVDITNYVTHDLGRPLHVFDADKLDSIGAIGIGRAFLFAGQVGAKLHNTETDITTSSPYTVEDTAYREFMVKLCRVKERMITPLGRQLAEERHDFMSVFFARLEIEINGGAADARQS